MGAKYAHHRIDLLKEQIQNYDAILEVLEAEGEDPRDLEDLLECRKHAEMEIQALQEDLHGLPTQ